MRACRVSAERLLISEYRRHAATETTGRALPCLARVPSPSRSRVCHTKRFPASVAALFFKAWQNTSDVLGPIFSFLSPIIDGTHVPLPHGLSSRGAAACQHLCRAFHRSLKNSGNLAAAGTSYKWGKNGYCDAIRALPLRRKGQLFEPPVLSSSPDEVKICVDATLTARDW